NIREVEPAVGFRRRGCSARTAQRNQFDVRFGKMFPRPITDDSPFHARGRPGWRRRLLRRGSLRKQAKEQNGKHSSHKPQRLVAGMIWRSAVVWSPSRMTTDVPLTSSGRMNSGLCHESTGASSKAYAL